jgi:hypothetical protein
VLPAGKVALMARQARSETATRIKFHSTCFRTMRVLVSCKLALFPMD